MLRHFQILRAPCLVLLVLGSLQLTGVKEHSCRSFDKRILRRLAQDATPSSSSHTFPLARCPSPSQCCRLHSSLLPFLCPAPSIFSSSPLSRCLNAWHATAVPVSMELLFPRRLATDKNKVENGLLSGDKKEAALMRKSISNSCRWNCPPLPLVFFIVHPPKAITPSQAKTHGRENIDSITRFWYMVLKRREWFTQRWNLLTTWRPRFPLLACLILLENSKGQIYILERLEENHSCASACAGVSHTCTCVPISSLESRPFKIPDTCQIQCWALRKQRWPGSCLPGAHTLER